jgi:hypothetical protein
MAQKVEIPAMHQVQAGAHQSDRPVAQVVRLPSFAGRRPHFAKQDLGDHPISLAGEVAVERAESKHQPLAPLRREAVRRTVVALAGDAAPQLQGCVSARREVCIKRDESRRGRCGVDTADQHGSDTTIFVADEPIVAIWSMAPECRCQLANIVRGGE